MGNINRALALQRAKDTLVDRFDQTVAELVKRAWVLEVSTHSDPKKIWGTQVPTEDVGLRLDGDQFVMSGWRWRGDCRESCTFSMPLAYANGDQSVVDALAAKNEADRKKALAETAARDRQAAIRREETDRKEFERLSKKYGS